jgi:hypothetical protein
MSVEVEKSTKRETYLTPKEIIETYPELIVKFNWTANDLGSFFKCRIIDGYYDRGKRNSMIQISSLRRLVEYVNKNLDSKKIQSF